jgi:hypothetical protein
VLLTVPTVRVVPCHVNVPLYLLCGSATTVLQSSAADCGSSVSRLIDRGIVRFDPAVEKWTYNKQGWHGEECKKCYPRLTHIVVFSRVVDASEIAGQPTVNIVNRYNYTI